VFVPDVVLRRDVEVIGLVGELPFPALETRRTGVPLRLRLRALDHHCRFASGLVAVLAV
jgi:hypothetical protein